jgi:hypothetical protein
MVKLFSNPSGQRRSFTFVDVDYNKFRDKMNEH